MGTVLFRLLRRLLFGSHLDGLEDLQITRTTAEIAAQRLFDTSAGRMGIFFQQGFGDKKNTGRALTTLRCA
jgi:hypothetical protein